MGVVRFISDLHFNHENCASFRGFENAQKMNKHIIETWNKVVHKKDVTYILGDITMEKKAGYELLDLLKGKKYVVLGNHDRRQDVRELLKHVDHVSGPIKYKNKYLLTHIPIHPKELTYRASINIHGHLHENNIHAYTWDFEFKKDVEILHPNYFNVSAEQLHYEPITLEEINKRLKTRF